MIDLLFMIPAIVFAGLLRAAWRERQALQTTSLAQTWTWGVVALLCWFGASLASGTGYVAAAYLDQFWYWTAVLSLCPLISVLGARRPASRVWDLFIVVPLLAVLGWPALTTLVHLENLPPIRVQGPVLALFVLPLAMGIGNYVGTRFTWAALIAGLGIALLAVSTSSAILEPGETGESLRLVASFVFAIGLGLAWRSRSPSVAAAGFDRLWNDFRDTFGIVWSIRIEERLNQTAEKEGWAARIEPQGLTWIPDASPQQIEATHERLERSLRWLLRRFVDPEWIDRRLSPGEFFAPTGNEPVDGDQRAADQAVPAPNLPVSHGR